jgi:hypothetical protein
MLVAVLATVLMTTSPPVTADARQRPSEDPGAVSTWNALAVTTLIADPTMKAPETLLYLAFVQAAVYDAVVGIDRRYTPYLFDAQAPRGSSATAAAVAAAHEVLVTYSPYARTTLDAAYRSSLAQIPDGKAKIRGITFGAKVADHLVASRRHDGRDAAVLFTQPPAPGVWRPTPPTFTPMLDPWLGLVTPLLVRSASQFAPPPPPSLTSEAYARDVAEVQALGSKDSTERTAAQTSTALFFSGAALVQFNAALRDQVIVRKLDLTDAARMFAAVNMTSADAITTVWRAKLFYGLWRPVTAINLADTDGNPATVADPNWTPLGVTPAYPEYPSGYNVLAAAVTGSLSDLFGTDDLNLTLISTAVPDQRTYATGAALRANVVDARIWLGFHFRSADIAARDLGLKLSHWALDRYFQPVREGDADGRSS